MSLRQVCLRAVIALSTIIAISAGAFAAPWSDLLQFLPFVSAEARQEKSLAPSREKHSATPRSVLLDSNFEAGDPTVWTTANGSSVNDWAIGSATASGGTQSAYVTNDGGTTNAYTITATEASTHIFTPITVPAGETAIVLSFDWKGVAEHSTSNNAGNGTSWDFIRVSLTSGAPVGGTVPITADQLPIIFNGQSTFTRAYVVLPASLAGTTRNLVFSWRNDASGGSTAGAIDNIRVVSQVPAPLAGTKAIQAGGDYTSLGAAIADLNANGADITGVTFNVMAGQTFNETPPVITATGTAAGPIVFQKVGAGANPIVISTGTGNWGPAGIGNVISSNDAVFLISGGDHITFDGIDAAGGALIGTTATTTAIEHGFFVRNASATNGAQNITIKNTSIALNRVNVSSFAILQSATTTGGGFVPTAVSGANSNNSYFNFTIGNSYNGINLLGTAAFPDLNNQVGTTGGGISTVGISAPLGGASGTTYGIRATSQSGVSIFSTEVGSVQNTGASVIGGIFLENAQGTNEIRSNKVHDIGTTSTSTSAIVYGIRADTNSTATTRIFNNMVWGFAHGITTASATQVGRGMAIGVNGGAGTSNVYFNSVRMETSAAASNTAFFAGGGTVFTRDNAFANFTPGNATAKHYAYYRNTVTTVLDTDFNDLFATSGTNNFVGFYAGAATPDRATLADWQVSTTNEFNSLSVDPAFVSNSDLHIDQLSPLEGSGDAVAGITTDIDGDARPATPDIGADEVSAPVGPGTVQFSSAVFAGTEGDSVLVTVNRVAGVSGAISVDYATSDGTATAGTCGSGGDYASASGTLNWADADNAPKTFSVQLCNDPTTPEAVENLNLTLSNAVGTTITGTNPATLNISDNPPGTLSFAGATLGLTPEGVTAQINVFRSGGSSGTVTVDYLSVAGGTASGGGPTCTPGIDYVDVINTLTWNEGESGAKSFNITICSDSLTEATETVFLALTNATGGATIGTGNTTLPIQDVASQFCNADGTITIPPTSGTPPFPSAPYPSVINVSGVSGTVSSVRVTLNGLAHTFPDDLDILLVGPGGQTYVLMSDTGGTTDIIGTTLTFADSAAAQSGDATAMVSGAFKPSNYEATNDVFATGAPAGPYGDPGPGGTPAGTATLNGIFGGTNPNGQWQLFISDDANSDGGSLQGWCLEILTNDPGTIAFTDPSYTVGEGVGTASISVERTGGTDGAVSASFGSSGSSATSGAACTAGVDFIAASGSLNWADGEGGVKNISLQVCDDATLETAESLFLALTGTTGGAVIGSPNPVDVTITDNDAVPGISVSPSNLAFGNQNVGTQSTPQSVTITNTGTANLVLGTLSITPNDGQFFLSTDPSGQTVTPGNSVQASIRFAPASVGAKSATLTVPSNASGPAPTVPLTGTGVSPEIGVSPTSIPFGNQQVGTTSANQTVTVQNTGTANLVITVGGPTNAQFALVGAPPPGTTILPGNQVQFQVNFSPTAAGPAAGTFTISSNDIDEPSTVVSLSGTGTQPGSLQFSTNAYSAAENAGNVVMFVTRTGGSDGAVSAQVTFTNVTATGGTTCAAGVDYINLPITVNFANGDSTQKAVNVPICNEAVDEADETYTATLGTPTGGATIGTPSSATNTIIDDDAVPTVTTSAATAVTATTAMLNGSANPNGSSATGWFRYSSVDPGTCNDSFGTRAPNAGGTALGSGTLNIPFSQNITGLTAGVTYYYCAIASNSSGTAFGAVVPFTAADPTTVQFGAASFMDDESQTMQVRVTRTGDTSGVSTVDYSTSNGTGAAGTCGSGGDYVAASGTVTFNAAVTEQIVPVTLCADTVTEGVENFSIVLSNPSGATLGTPSTATGNINDTATQFRDASAIQLFGPTAVPYPAQITVVGGPTTIGSIRVTLYDLLYTNPDDIDVLLVGPGGEQILLMADAGGANAVNAPTTLTFSDAAGQVLPDASLLTTGLYEPTSWVGPEASFPGTAPPAPYNEPGSSIGGTPSLSSVFGGTNANGTWSLFVHSDAGGSFGELGASSGFAGGWGLELLAPTAANSTLSGRIADAGGAALSNVVVTIEGGGLAAPISTRSNTFGNYSFRDLPTGHVYTVTVSSRRYVFANPTQVVTVNDNVGDMDFTAASSQ